MVDLIHLLISYSSSQSDTLPETNSSHLKMDGWNTGFPFGTRPIFQVAKMLVSGSVIPLLGTSWNSKPPSSPLKKAVLLGGSSHLVSG